MVAHYPGVLLTEPGDTFTSIAEKLYGDASAAHALALQNGYISVGDKLASGYLLIVPEFLKERLLAGNNNPYYQFQNQMMGAILPHVDMVKYKPHVRSVWFKVLVKAILLAAVIAISGGMAASFGALIGIDATTAFATLTALGDAGVQGLSMAVGLQDKFSINETLETAVNSLLLGAGSLNSITEALERAGSLVITTAETQLVEMAIGTRKQFNVGDIITQVGANLIGSKFGELLNTKLPLTTSASATFLKNTVSNVLTNTATSVIGNTVSGSPTDFATTLANSLGNTIGNAAGDNVNAKLQQIKNHYKPAEAITEASTPAHSKLSGAVPAQSAKNPNNTRTFIDRMQADLTLISQRMSAINDEIKLINNTQQGRQEKLTPTQARKLTALQKAKRAGDQIIDGAIHDGKTYLKTRTKEIYTRLTTGAITERLKFAQRTAMFLPQDAEMDNIAEVANGIKTGRINASTVKAYYANLIDEALHDENAWDQLKAGGAIVGDTLGVIGLVSGTAMGARWGAERLLASRMFTANLAAKSSSLTEIELGAQKIVHTGGRQITTINAWNEAERQAIEFYENIRRNTSNIDVSIISKNSGMPEFQVQKVKQHLFFNAHKLDAAISRFAPDIEIADAWLRLQKGNFVKQDLMLLKHEYFEARFMGIFKTDYTTAHQAANYSKRTWDPTEFVTSLEISRRF